MTAKHIANPAMPAHRAMYSHKAMASATPTDSFGATTSTQGG